MFDLMQSKSESLEEIEEIQMSIYPGKGGVTSMLSNVVKKGSVRGCISW